MTWFEGVSDPAGINQALFEITHVLTSSRGVKLNGQCLDAAMQITNAPPRIAIGVGKKSLTHEMIADTGKFALSAIDRTANSRTLAGVKEAGVNEDIL
ncbi:flavin reductase [Candidatus Bipolaricaulota bacterium]|nr:flavin reductase [Candidatus Bipolaricaulota bacterium]